MSIEEGLKKNGYHASTTSGYSMYPLLRDRRDNIVVRPCSGRLKKYDVPLYKRGNEYVLHRIIKVLPDGYVICGDNCINKEYNIKDENILATPIHLRVWQQSDSPRGELIRYTEREQLLLEQLEHGTLLSLNRYCRQTGLSRRAAEHLLAKFVRYDIVEPVFENHKFYFRIKNE